MFSYVIVTGVNTQPLHLLHQVTEIVPHDELTPPLQLLTTTGQTSPDETPMELNETQHLSNQNK